MKNIVPFLLSACTGILLFIGVSYNNFWFLVPISLVLLFYLKKWYLWFVSGFLFFSFSLWWINISMIKYGGIPSFISYTMVTLLCFFLTILQFLTVYKIWKWSGYRHYIIPLVWVLFEILRSYFPYGGFPWLILGNISVNVSYLGLSIRYITVYGFSFFIVLFSIGLFYILRDNRKVRGILVSSSAFITVFLLSLLADTSIKKDMRDAEFIKVGIIQPFIEQRIKLDEYEFRKKASVYFPLMDEAIKEGAKILFLPEYAFPFLFSQGYDEMFLKLMEMSEKVPLVVGLVDIHYTEEGIEPRTSAYLIYKGREIDRYDKIRLLPFGEYLPFPFGFAKEIFRVISGPDYVPGKDYTPLEMGKLKIATFICFEVGYVDLVKRIASKGNLIAVLTNDGWFDNSLGVYQHLNIARARAVENGKFLVWVNNTGPSAVINPRGKIVAVIDYGLRDILVTDVALLR